VIAGVLIFVIGVIMAMTGRGGGNFYVPVLIASGIAVHEAATIAQLLLVVTATAALLVFQKHRTVDWRLALVIDPPTDIMAFFGGLYAHVLSALALKMVFAMLLVLAAFLMLKPVKEPTRVDKKRIGFWRRQYGSYSYIINLWLAIPVTAVTGFIAGMTGISGGSFKIPLMVLACGVPMRIAVGTSSAMVAATALMGFVGHVIGGDFNPNLAIIIFVIIAVVGGLFGGRFSIRIRPERLKRIFAYTTLAAALFMFLTYCTLWENSNEH
jgi:uncharacterized membrane protein YfcA